MWECDNEFFLQIPFVMLMLPIQTVREAWISQHAFFNLKKDLGQGQVKTSYPKQVSGLKWIHVLQYQFLTFWLKRHRHFSGGQVSSKGHPHQIQILPGPPHQIHVLAPRGGKDFLREWPPKMQCSRYPWIAIGPAKKKSWRMTSTDSFEAWNQAGDLTFQLTSCLQASALFGNMETSFKVWKLAVHHGKKN